jgi:hypothetical protein
MKVFFAIIIICSAFLSGCYYDSQENLYPTLNDPCSDTTNVTYSGTIVPIIQRNCISCHNTATPENSNVQLSSYENVKIFVDNKQLLNSINHVVGITAMPQNSPKLDDCTIISMTKWIKAGAPNN